MNRITELTIIEEDVSKLKGVEQVVARHRLEIAKTINANGQDCGYLIDQINNILHDAQMRELYNLFTYHE